MSQEQVNLASFLKSEFQRRVTAHPRYSLRAFAKSLRMSPGQLSEVFSGKRSLGIKAALKIAQALKLTREESRDLLELIQLDRLKRLDGSLHSESEKKTQIELDRFQVIADWYCLAILNLADTEGFRCDPRWIAKRLEITPSQVQEALNRLERVGLLRRPTKEQWVFCEDFVEMGGVTPSQAIRSYHTQMLSKAQLALEQSAFDERDITGLSFATDPSSMASIKKDISSFLDRLAKKYSRTRKKEVYHCEVAFFKLSKEIPS